MRDVDVACNICLSLLVGQKCTVANATGSGASSVGFDGLLDEVAVW